MIISHGGSGSSDVCTEEGGARADDMKGREGGEGGERESRGGA